MADHSPTASPAILVRMAGESDTREFTQSFHVGRAAGSDVVLEDDQVSQQHAAVELVEGRWHIQDLESSNGIFIAGKQVERAPISDTVLVRFGHDGPTLVLTIATPHLVSRETVVSEPSESLILNRFLGGRTPADMSRHTALLRRVLRTEQQRRAKRYWVALAALAVVAVIASAYVYVQRKQIERARMAAADLFYAMKSLELEVARLRLNTPDAQTYRDQRGEMRRQYLNYLEQLGIYGDDTPQDIQLIYRVVHRFGESEVNVPRAFVDKLEAVGRETRYGIAKGMWQFMPATARAYGLQTGPLVGVAQFDPRDDRHNLEESTRAAAEYLRDIYTTDAQASGLLVMASYNWGQGNVLRLIRTMPESPRERNFWKLLSQYRDRIPDETYHYVFSIVSAAVIGENPQLFGFDFDPPLPREQATNEATEGQ
jgi:pSer/pThr/pTyr-binding forkhead associated (FHA) protein